MFHNFHVLQSDMVFGIVKAFSRIFDAISSEKRCSTLILFLLTYIGCRTVEFFPPAESWLVNSYVRRGSCMQGGSPMAKYHVGLNTSHWQGYKMVSVMPAKLSKNVQLSQRNDWPEPATIARDRSLQSTKESAGFWLKTILFLGWSATHKFSIIWPNKEQCCWHNVLLLLLQSIKPYPRETVSFFSPPQNSLFALGPVNKCLLYHTGYYEANEISWIASSMTHCSIGLST